MPDIIEQYGLVGGVIVALSSMGVAIATLAIPKKNSNTNDEETTAHTCMNHLAPYVSENLKVNTQLLALLEQNQSTMQNMLEILHDNSLLTKEVLLILKNVSEELRRRD